MQLQLALAVADRLHETLLVRGEPLPALDAAGLLLAASRVPEWIAQEVIDALVRHDRRFCQAAPEAGLVSLTAWEVPDPELADIPFVVLDLETTGSRPGPAKITEIGAVRLEGLREVGHFHALVNPQRPIPPFITHITGITQEMVAGAPRIDEIMPELLSFLDGAIIVAHNAPFDVSFLNYELRRLNGKKLGEGAFDTLPLARLLAPGLPNYRLGTVAEALGAPVSACHRALADARATAHVFRVLVGRLQEQGVTRLKEARAFLGAHAASAREKLGLTRDLPLSPGVYRLVDRNGMVLYVGKADRLRERVRSYFLDGNGHSRKLRQAVRLVERIEWEETATPLEAVVLEQEQILAHRPPCNLHGGRPEGYTYLKLSFSGPGLGLSLSSRPSSRAFSGDSRGHDSRSPLLIGPFRGHARLRSALDLLLRCYPVRTCSQKAPNRPCVRLQGGACLAPCARGPEVRRQHDILIWQLLSWLAGNEEPDLPCPLERSETLVRSLSRQRRFEEARALTEAREHLLSVRRSYQALAEARTLRFAALWPAGDGADRRAVRINLVWDGCLRPPLTLSRRDCEHKLEELLEELFGEDGRSSERPREDGRETAARGSGRQSHSSALAPLLVAVPQRKLDIILAVRRWLLETSHPHIVMLPGPDADADRRDLCRHRLLAETRRLLEHGAVVEQAV